MKITIDTVQDSFGDAVAAVHGAYGVPQPGASDDDIEEGVFDGDDEPNADDFYPGKWTRKRIRKLAQWVAPDAAEALRYMAERAPAVDIEEVFQHMADYTGIEGFNGKHMGGRMSSVGFAQSAIGGVGAVYDTDYKHRKYRMDKGIAKVLLEELKTT